MRIEVCRKRYLPRETQDEISNIDGRTVLIKNYTKYSQLIGE